MRKISEVEYDALQDIVSDYAMYNMPEIIFEESLVKALVGVTYKDGKRVTNMQQAKQLQSDMEMCFVIVMTRMAYDYSVYRESEAFSELEAMRHLNNKYIEVFFEYATLRKGMALTATYLQEVVGQMVLEMPYLYQVIVSDTLDVSEEDLPDIDGYTQFSEELYEESNNLFYEEELMYDEEEEEELEDYSIDDLTEEDFPSDEDVDND